jgi:hypothetical protein
VAVLVAQVRRHRGRKRFGLYRLRHTLIDGVEQIANIDRHENVGGRIRAFRFYAFGKAVLDEDRIDLDLRVLGESVEQRLDQAGFARRLKIDFLRAGDRRQGNEG